MQQNVRIQWQTFIFNENIMSSLLKFSRILGRIIIAKENSPLKKHSQENHCTLDRRTLKVVKNHDWRIEAC